MKKRVTSNDHLAVLYRLALERFPESEYTEVVLDEELVKSSRGELSGNSIRVTRGHRHVGESEQPVPTFIVTVGRSRDKFNSGGSR